MQTHEIIEQHLQEAARSKPCNPSRFFKTGPGDYAEHDQFMGVTIPQLRKIAQTFSNVTLQELHPLITSPFNEQRLLALFILIQHYQRKTIDPTRVYHYYLEHIDHVNNWNLVDASAHHIIGTHCATTNNELLLQLIHAPNMWHRRIAIIATLYFIRNNQLELTFMLAEKLLQDNHDLLHKATGWMLREAGKKSPEQLQRFLNAHAHKMPRTMLRYSLEKFPKDLRNHYLKRI